MIFERGKNSGKCACIPSSIDYREGVRFHFFFLFYAQAFCDCSFSPYAWCLPFQRQEGTDSLYRESKEFEEEGWAILHSRECLEAGYDCTGGDRGFSQCGE